MQTKSKFNYRSRDLSMKSRDLSMMSSLIVAQSFLARITMAFAADAGAKESRRGRKRLRYEEQWVKKKRKLAKDKGASYATYKG